MSDNEIRKILAERKRKERRREALRDHIEGFISFTSLIWLLFLMSALH